MGLGNECCKIDLFVKLLDFIVMDVEMKNVFYLINGEYFVGVEWV